MNTHAARAATARRNRIAAAAAEALAAETRPTQECPTCYGEGKYCLDGSGAAASTVTCGSCDGQGKIVSLDLMSTKEIMKVWGGFTPLGARTPAQMIHIMRNN